MAPVYAINLFNLASREEYLAYARRSTREVGAHNGKVVALGEFADTITGDLAPRRVFILVEWASRADFDSYRNDPALADLHPHRENGTADYLWLLYDKLDDLRPILREAERTGSPELTARARELATRAHADQVDKAGAPYITHPARVAARLSETDAQTVAWLHDVVEDTLVTLDDLRVDFPEHVVQAVDALSKRPGEAPAEYYSRVRANGLATTVKLADLADNSDPARLARLDEATRGRLTAKYASAIERLRQSS